MLREVADEDFCSDLLSSLVLTRLVHLNWLVEQFDHVEDLDGVVCVLFSLKLDKAVALVLVGHLVTGNVNVDDRASLEEQFP